jgi:hypothetical protein
MVVIEALILPSYHRQAGHKFYGMPLSDSRSKGLSHSRGVLPHSLEDETLHREVKKNLNGQVLLGFAMKLL